MEIENKIKDMLESEVEKAGVKIDSIKLERENGNLFLKIVIDREEIIDIDKFSYIYYFFI